LYERRFETSCGKFIVNYYSYINKWSSALQLTIACSVYAPITDTDNFKKYPIFMAD